MQLMMVGLPPERDLLLLLLYWINNKEPKESIAICLFLIDENLIQEQTDSNIHDSGGAESVAEF